MSKDQTYETERLLLRPTILDDAAFILELLNTPKWLKFIGDRNVTTIESAEEYIKSHMFPAFKKNGFGNYTVIRKTDDRKIGNCGLYDREGVDGIDIGFAFLPAFEKQGYAFESASKVKELGIKEFGLLQISAITNPENTGSQKLLEKLGLGFSTMIKLPKSEEALMLYKWKSK